MEIFESSAITGAAFGLLITLLVAIWTLAIGQTMLWWCERRERSRSDIERWRRHRAQQRSRR